MATSTQDKALEFARRCERAGKPVRRIVIDGRRFEVEFGAEAKPESPDDIRWGK